MKALPFQMVFVFPLGTLYKSLDFILKRSNCPVYRYNENQFQTGFCSFDEQIRSIRRPRGYDKMLQIMYFKSKQASFEAVHISKEKS